MTEYTAMQYIEDVVSGKQVACKWVRLACQRHLDDLAHGADRGLWFDEDAAKHIIDFFQFCRHSKGQWAGQTIHLEPWQQFILWVAFGWMRADEDSGDPVRRFRTVYEEVARKNGKALALETPLPTPNGWISMGEVQLGTVLFDEHGQPCSVRAMTEVMHDRPCYRVAFSDGEEIIADAEHLWRVSARRTQRPGGAQLKGIPRDVVRNYPEHLILTTEKIRQTLMVDSPSNIRLGRVEYNYRIDTALPIDLPDADLLIPPYTFGAWLGDGSSASARLTCSYEDTEVLEYIKEEGVSVVERVSSNKNSGLFLLGSGGRSQKSRDGSLQSQLRQLGVLNNKHIPPIYLRSSIAQRMNLLQGLMDSDGYVSVAGQCEFTTISDVLCRDVHELLCSLGYKPTVKTDVARLYGREISPKYRIQFWSYQDRPVFKLERKRQRLKATPAKKTRSNNRQIVAVESVESVPVRCIQVDSPSHLFLAGRSMIPTHNSTFASGVGIYMLDADGEAGAEIYSAATKKDQAKITFDEASRMVKASPSLRKRIRPVRDNLHIVNTAAKFEPLGRDTDSMDGLNVHCAIVDEVHAHKNRETWDLLETATGSRQQPMMVGITTAGFDRNSLCWDLHQYTEKVLEGIIADDSFFGVIYGLDLRQEDAEGNVLAEGDDWEDETCWVKANPNLGVSKKWADMRAKLLKAKEMPSMLNSFLRRELNIWTQAVSRWVNAERWAACGEAVNWDGLAGRSCYAALDLSSTTDITALALVFPPLEPGDAYQVLVRFYIPEDTMKLRSKRDRVPYVVWVRQGHITSTPGNVIDYAFIMADFDELMQRYDIAEVAYDPWGATQIQTQLKELRDDGGDEWLIQFRQGFASMSPAMKAMERLYMAGELVHGNNPVLNWMASNLVVREDPAGNVKPDKAKSTEKIDGMVALAMAIDRAVRQAADDGSIYDEQDVKEL